MTLDICPLHTVVGARIEGIDLSEPVSQQDFDIIEQTLHKSQVLVFPDQPLTVDTFLNFAKLFGEPEIYKLRGYGGVPDGKTKLTEPPPLVQRLTNLNSDGVPMGPCPQMDRMAIAENWHSDSSYRAVPSYLTLLHGVEVPPVGGDTHFTSLHAAYDSLSDEMRERIENFNVLHSWEYQRTLAPGVEPITDDERRSVPPVIHKLVQRHPQTGRKLLFLSSGAESIVELPYAEGRDLLAQLLEMSTRPTAVYTHKWKARDVVMWDNRATLHRAGDFDYRSRTLRRLLHRIVIAGDPEAYDAQVVMAESST